MIETFFITVQSVPSFLWTYLLPFVVVLSVLVFVHEWGHYIVARMCGVRVETFSIGFGKELFGFTDGAGTRWKFSLIPLGGYVKMFGDTDPASAGQTDTVKDGEEPPRPMTEEERRVAFFNKPVHQRAAIVFAGPAINFIFAIILLLGLFTTLGQPATPPQATGIVVGSPADEAGFEPGDTITSVNGEKIRSFEKFQRMIMVALDTPLKVQVEGRNAEKRAFKVTPEVVEVEDRFGFTHSFGRIGIIGPGNGLGFKWFKKVDGQDVENPVQAKASLREIIRQRPKEAFTVTMELNGKVQQIRVAPKADYNRAWLNPEQDTASDADMRSAALVLSDPATEYLIDHNPLSATAAAFGETADISMRTLEALGQIFTGVRSPEELGGVIRIAAIASDTFWAGAASLITFMALLSINLGLINLFPIPMLDGGHLALYAVEAVKGSPLNEKAMDYLFRLGFVIIFALFIFVTWNDLSQLITGNLF